MRKEARTGVSMTITLPAAPKRTVLGPPPACSRMRLTASSVRLTMALASGSRSCPLAVHSTCRP